MGRKNEQDRLTAYHEAAHVVARYRLPQTGEVIYSTIQQGSKGHESSAGYTEGRWKPDGDATLTKEETIAAYKEMERTPEFIMLTLAGPAAEYVYLRWPDGQYFDFMERYMDAHPKGAPSDQAQAWYRLKTDNEEETLDRFDEAWRHAIGFVRAEWESINEVARLLLEKKTVQGKELYAQIMAIDERKES